MNESMERLRRKFARLFAKTYTRRRFSRIYKHNEWKGADSRSGTGSDLLQTSIVRRELPQLLRRLEAKSMLDIPCGDFNWMRDVSLPVERYIGADIVRELVAQNTQLYAKPDRQFVVLDLIRDPLPTVDVIFCRDCLVHLSHKDIFQALRNFRASKSQWLLTTTFPTRDRNQDIETGDWRPLNFQVAPFSVPPPVELIDEQCTENGGIYADKSLGLWRIEDLWI